MESYRASSVGGQEILGRLDLVQWPLDQAPFLKTRGLAWLSSSRHAVHRCLWIPDSERGSIPPSRHWSAPMTLSDTRQSHRPLMTSRPLPSPMTGLPQLPAHPSDMPCSLPRWTGTDASVGCYPIHAGIPRNSGGSASMTHFRPAQASHTLRPAGLLNRPSGLYHEASTQPVARQSRSSATRPCQQLPGWILPPLVNRAVGAHCAQAGVFATGGRS